MLPFVTNTFVLSTFEWLFYTGFTVAANACLMGGLYTCDKYQNLMSWPILFRAIPSGGSRTTYAGGAW